MKADIREERFGRLVAKEWVGKTPSRNSLWRCECDCGGEKTTTLSNLRSLRTTSCGCFHSERASAAHKRHGKSRSRVYGIWTHMLQRCANSRRPGFDNYGGRGITVCARWMRFENFYADMGDPPKGHNLERRDNNQGYKPGNCYWATPAQQARNTRRNVNIEWKGRTQCLTDWALELNIPILTLFNRYYKGMPLDRMMTTGRLHKSR